MYMPAADGELKTLRKRFVLINCYYNVIHENIIIIMTVILHLIREEKAILTKHLGSCQEQLITLNKELEVYQQLLEEANGGITVEGDLSIGGGSSDKVRQLLEEIRALRKQLEQSTRNNATLSDQLTHKTTHQVKLILLVYYTVLQYYLPNLK